MTEIKNWLNTNDAAALTNYSQDYMRLLARRGHVQAVKVGRDWLLWKPDVLAHKARMDALGSAKHNPWREDLATGRRGRKANEEVEKC